MKKITAFLLAICMLVSFAVAAGCDNFTKGQKEAKEKIVEILNNHSDGPGFTKNNINKLADVIVKSASKAGMSDAQLIGFIDFGYEIILDMPNFIFGFESPAVAFGFMDYYMSAFKALEIKGEVYAKFIYIIINDGKNIFIDIMVETELNYYDELQKKEYRKEVKDFYTKQYDKLLKCATMEEFVTVFATLYDAGQYINNSLLDLFAKIDTDTIYFVDVFSNISENEFKTLIKANLEAIIEYANYFDDNFYKALTSIMYKVSEHILGRTGFSLIQEKAAIDKEIKSMKDLMRAGKTVCLAMKNDDILLSLLYRMVNLDIDETDRDIFIVAIAKYTKLALDNGLDLDFIKDIGFVWDLYRFYNYDFSLFIKDIEEIAALNYGDELPDNDFIDFLFNGGGGIAVPTYCDCYECGCYYSKDCAWYECDFCNCYWYYY